MEGGRDKGKEGGREGWTEGRWEGARGREQKREREKTQVNQLVGQTKKQSVCEKTLATEEERERYQERGDRWKERRQRERKQEKCACACVWFKEKEYYPLNWLPCIGSVPWRLLSFAGFAETLRAEFRFTDNKSNAGRTTDFWDKESSDFSGEIFRERNFGSSITALQPCSH